MPLAVAALLAAHPAGFTESSAQEWVRARRALLVARADPVADTTRIVSSGCAASGARTHALALAEDAAHALARLDAGLGPTCEACGDVLALERMDAAPLATRCTGCARPYAPDTRWCR